MTDSTWTSEPPSEAGWYWIRIDEGCNPDCAYFWFAGTPSKGMAWYCDRPHVIDQWEVMVAACEWQRSTAPIESAEALAEMRAIVAGGWNAEVRDYRARFVESESGERSLYIFAGEPGSGAWVWINVDAKDCAGLSLTDRPGHMLEGFNLGRVRSLFATFGVAAEFLKAARAGAQEQRGEGEGA